MASSPKASPGKWLVLHGYHDGHFVNRDIERYERDTEQEAREAFAEACEQYRAMGYITWTAHLYDDKGTMTNLMADS